MNATMTRPATRPAPGEDRSPGRYRSDSIDLAPHPGAVALARLHVRRTLGVWDLGELEADASQVTSEIVANAIEAHHHEHLNAPVRLTLLAGLRTLLIAVRDASTAMPVPAQPGPDLESGRGLLTVSALAAQWDAKPLAGGGKTVRALLRGSRRA
ncbi:MAG: ATP-binding protein [Streptosporangiales bacterium]|nr:ATP-binding protein [Streptosporangiales bacterium]